MEFNGKDIPPDISEEERKINMENLFNTMFRVSKLEGFSHCIYDTMDKTVHVYVED